MAARRECTAMYPDGSPTTAGAGAATHRPARRLTDALIELAGRDSFEVYSTRRQIFRYFEWFDKVFDLAPLVGLAIEVFEKFPEDVEERWK